MSSFNFDEFKKGRIAIMRDGREVKFIAQDESLASSHNVVVNMEGHLGTYTVAGEFAPNGESIYDLVAMKTVTIRKYVVISVFKDGTVISDRFVYFKSAADARDRLAEYTNVLRVMIVEYEEEQ